MHARSARFVSPFRSLGILRDDQAVVYLELKKFKIHLAFLWLFATTFQFSLAKGDEAAIPALLIAQKLMQNCGSACGASHLRRLAIDTWWWKADGHVGSAFLILTRHRTLLCNFTWPSRDANLNPLLFALLSRGKQSLDPGAIARIQDSAFPKSNDAG
jgi:hypothetical protein